MKIYICITFLLLILATSSIAAPINSDTIIVRLGITDKQISLEWRNALVSRMNAATLDSVSKIQKPLTNEEKAWITLIESKTKRWNLFKDSLEIPFNDCRVPDTIYILLGFSGVDDGFTYQFNTICFDLTALHNNYGSAADSVNNERIDRLFTHEFTHLVHKEWARKNNITLQSFKDSVLWECIYEGIGMYRSLSKKWLPHNGILPDITTSTLEQLSPIFVERLAAVNNSKQLSEIEKKRIVANLSRGPVAKKWGAFTVALWLALEANGKDENLVYWTDNGMNSVILLAKKYLSGTNKVAFEKIFPGN